MIGSASGNAVPGEPVGARRSPFDGVIDEVALYPHALSAADIAEHAALVPEPGSIAGLAVAGLALLARPSRQRRK
jgi:hypothetical protein